MTHTSYEILVAGYPHTRYECDDCDSTLGAATVWDHAQNYGHVTRMVAEKHTTYRPVMPELGDDGIGDAP